MKMNECGDQSDAFRFSFKGNKSLEVWSCVPQFESA